MGWIEGDCQHGNYRPACKRCFDECCAQLGCGHSRDAHGGHTHRVGTPAPTHCSQGCGCRAFLPRIGRVAG